jgi:glyoxylase-like metal-dependent hydrolase (beta-lactamase superfamily II)
VDVQELKPGLWRWTARHPDWTPEEGGPDGWEPEIGCVYYEAADAVVLIDPLVPDDAVERFWRALDRDLKGKPLAILITVFWHARSAQQIAERYGARVWINPRELTRTLERLPAELLEQFELGDPLPGGVEAYDADRKNEVVFWIPQHRALVAGDVLLGTQEGGVRMCPESWLGGEARETVRATLMRLLDLPVELILLAHGEPVVENAHAALQRALA